MSKCKRLENITGMEVHVVEYKDGDKVVAVTEVTVLNEGKPKVVLVLDEKQVELTLSMMKKVKNTIENHKADDGYVIVG